MSFPLKKGFWYVIYFPSASLRSNYVLISYYLCTGPFVDNIIEANCSDLDTPCR